jgi:hypothetical protein
VVPFGYDVARFKFATFDGVIGCGAGMLEGGDEFEGGCGGAGAPGVEVPEEDVLPTACREPRVRTGEKEDVG